MDKIKLSLFERSWNMFTFILPIFLLGCGFYSLTYGISLWKDKNKLGAVGASFIAVAGTVTPLILLFIKM